MFRAMPISRFLGSAGNISAGTSRTVVDFAERHGGREKLVVYQPVADNDKLYRHCPVRSEQVGRDIDHWWRLDPPDGPSTVGRCRFCGSMKKFANSVYIKFGNLELG
jgi:hypothetical protein